MKKNLLVLIFFVAVSSLIFNQCKKDDDDNNSNCNTPATPVASQKTPGIIKKGDPIELTTADSLPNATYSWTGPNAFTANGRNVKILNSTVAMSGEYKVIATLDGCPSLQGKVTVDVKELKSIPFLGGTLYIYPVDNSVGIGWNNPQQGFRLTSATDESDGKANTTAIFNMQGNTDVYAANICQNLVGFGFSDWYLPAKDELERMYINSATIGGFTNEEYWTSTETGLQNAWFIDFTDGTKTDGTKLGAWRVRCIRK